MRTTLTSRGCTLKDARSATNMKALGMPANTPSEHLRRRIALVLDNAFTRGTGPRDHRLLLSDFDILVNALAAAAEQSGPWAPNAYAEALERADAHTEDEREEFLCGLCNRINCENCPRR